MERKTPIGMISLYKQKIRHEEGKTLKTKIDDRGKKIKRYYGYGHNLNNPIPAKILAMLLNDGDPTLGIEELLHHDIMGVIRILNVNLPWWLSLPRKAKIVLVDLVFQLGWEKVKQKRSMLTAMGKGDYLRASKCLVDSRYGLLYKSRAERNRALLKGAV